MKRKNIILAAVFIFISSVFINCGKQVREEQFVKFSLMVPPFLNLSGNNDYNYIAIGLADELSRRLGISGRFNIIDPVKIFQHIEVTQLWGREEEEAALFRELRNMNAQYGVIGRVKIDDKGKTIELNAKIIRSADNVVLANESEEGDVKDWSSLRGMLAIKVTRRLGIPLSPSEEARLRESETTDLEAFKLNYIGKIYYYQSLESKYRSKEREAQRYRNIAMAYWVKSAEKDKNYNAPKQNYADSMDAGDVRSSTEKKVEKAQGSLNAMIMYGFLYKKDRVFNANAWVRANEKELREMVNTLPAGYVIEVQGHTDSSGPEEPVGDKPGNIAISKKRAEAVYRAMLNIGISADRLEYKGYGSSRAIPWLDSIDPSNRRVSFEVKPRTR